MVQTSSREHLPPTAPLGSANDLGLSVTCSRRGRTAVLL